MLHSVRTYIALVWKIRRNCSGVRRGGEKYEAEALSATKSQRSPLSTSLCGWSLSRNMLYKIYLSVELQCRKDRELPQVNTPAHVCIHVPHTFRLYDDDDGGGGGSGDVVAK